MRILQFPRPLTIADIKARLNPGAGAVDVYQDFLYDTMQYPAAGLAVGQQLAFFADPTHVGLPELSNMVASINQMQPGHTFHAVGLTLDILSVPSETGAATAAGQVDDVYKILFGSRGIVEYVNQRERRTRGAIPLHAIGGSGGVVGTIAATETAPGIAEAGNNALGAYPLDALLPAQQGFSLNLTARATQAISGNTMIRLGLFGWHYIER